MFDRMVSLPSSWASDGAVAHFQSMMMDVDQVAKAMKDAEMCRDRGLPRRLQAAHLPRHAGRPDPGGDVVEQDRLERAVEGPEVDWMEFRRP
jgi:hypothetical protein